MNLRPNLSAAQVRSHVDRVGKASVGLVGYGAAVIWLPVDRDAALRILRESSGARFDLYAVPGTDGEVAEVRFRPAEPNADDV